MSYTQRLHMIMQLARCRPNGNARREMPSATDRKHLDHPRRTSVARLRAIRSTASWAAPLTNASRPPGAENTRLPRTPARCPAPQPAGSIATRWRIPQPTGLQEICFLNRVHPRVRCGLLSRGTGPASSRRLHRKGRHGTPETAFRTSEDAGPPVAKRRQTVRESTRTRRAHGHAAGFSQQVREMSARNPPSTATGVRAIRT